MFLFQRKIRIGSLYQAFSPQVQVFASSVYNPCNIGRDLFFSSHSHSIAELLQSNQTDVKLLQGYVIFYAITGC